MTELEEKLLQFIANLYRMNEIAPNQLSGMLDDYRCVIESYGYNQEVKKTKFNFGQIVKKTKFEKEKQS